MGEFVFKGDLPFVSIKMKEPFDRDSVMEALDRYVSGPVASETAFGELGDSTSEDLVDLRRVSHRVTDIKVFGDRMELYCKFLDTPMGKVLETMVDEGVEMETMTRAIGHISDGKTICDSIVAINFITKIG